MSCSVPGAVRPFGRSVPWPAGAAARSGGGHAGTRVRDRVDRRPATPTASRRGRRPAGPWRTRVSVTGWTRSRGTPSRSGTASTRSCCPTCNATSRRRPTQHCSRPSRWGTLPIRLRAGLRSPAVRGGSPRGGARTAPQPRDDVAAQRPHRPRLPVVRGRVRGRGRLRAAHGRRDRPGPAQAPTPAGRTREAAGRRRRRGGRTRLAGAGRAAERRPPARPAGHAVINCPETTERTRA